ncbi:DUF4262 domain-containing protein [Streptomyces sp. V4-01]|uniref:DUF4262 domain-containing protein n=1 Tax=Actinacidiphila polyblastidii TaxID=3110430 RepID=A0ABU7P4W8_9ACTN|nr:DUF4262 domain-containing protein [Streptomyces sp. V4-01]
MVPADDNGPGWACTIGLWHSHRLPEPAVFGLGAPAMHTVLNDLGRLAVAGQPVAAPSPGSPVGRICWPVKPGWTCGPTNTRWGCGRRTGERAAAGLRRRGQRSAPDGQSHS